MDNSEVNKTSDEIINELFSSLNVPLSPKVAEVEERLTSKGEQLSAHTGDSENSEDDESDSKSSESEGETKPVGGEMQGNRPEKLKSLKKKKDKRKKKKKHRKKEDGGRHKHKKKKKKENFETAEEAKLAGDILQDVKLKNQAVIQKIMIHEEVTTGATDDKEHEKRKSRSKSPRLLNTQGEVDEVDNKKKLVPESQKPCEDVLASNREGAVSLPVVSEDRGYFPEGASKSDVQPCPTHEKSPGAESVSRSSQVSPTAGAGEHKRKHSSRSCSPSPVKKQKSSSSASPPESSSPKAASRLRSPDSAERSRSRSAKDTKSCRRTKSRSPLVKQSAQSDRSGSKSRRSRSRSRKRSESEKRSGSRKRSTSKSRKKLDSKSKKRSRSRSKKRSRSRSRKSRSRSRRSRSRSRRRSRSRSRRKARSRSKSRRGSKSRRRSRSKSKVRSRSKSKSRRRSRSKSSKRSGSKSGRKSASKSNRSKSRERSRSRSRRRSGLRGVRSRSRSRSQSRQRSSSKSGKRSGSSLRRRSRSRSKSRRSRSRGSQPCGRSRSRSSHKSSPGKERFDMFAVMRERASRLAELKNQGIPDGSLGSLLLSAAANVQSGGGGGGVSQSVPTSDPSSIPLPQKDLLQADSPPREEAEAESIVAIDEDKPADVADDTVSMLSPEQDASKARDGSKNKQDEGSDKGKLKTIITIKSLKDSLVFQQAQEEAERKAKEMVDQPVGHDSSNGADRKGGHKQGSTERHHQDEAKQDESTSLEGKEKYHSSKDRAESEENIKKHRKEEKEKGDEKRERKLSEEKRKGESFMKEMHIETEVFRQKAEMEDREAENNKHTEKTKANTEEADIESKMTSRKMAVTKTKEREEEKESKHSSKMEKEERKGSRQSSKVKEDEEHDGNKLCSELEDNKGSKQSTKTEEDGKKIKLSSKTDKVEENKGHKLTNKVVEREGGEEDKVTKQCSAKGKEEEVTANYSSSKGEEEERRNKLFNKTEEKEEEKLSKLSSKMEEDKSKGSKSSKAEEREEGMKSRHSSKVEDKEDSKGSKELCKELSGKNGHSHPEEDPADKIEEGEITSDKEEEEIKPPSKTHSKKSKKDKYSSKEKKRSHKDKSKNKEEKKKAHDKKKEQEKARSKDTHKSRQHSSNSGSKEHSHSRRHRKHSHSRSRSRSRSRDHSSRQHRRSHSRSRSKSRSKRRRESTSDLRDKVTRKRLLEIARRNAVYLMQNGCLPPSVEKEQLVKIKAGGKSVDELTDFCKQLVASGNYSDVDVSEPSMSSEEENSSEKPFSSTRHPFSVRDSKPILMNIRNAPMLPTKTNAERLAGQAKLREQFPVSSGSQHRTKESEWVPVTPKEKKEEDKVFTKPEAPSVDISQIVSTRLSAMRKLQDNPNDSEAIKTLNNVQKEMQNWALSKQEPGQFTGTTGVKVLSQEELSSGHQAWARKEQFKEAAPVRPHFGLKMLQKMGWSPGEGLGKNKEGTTEPLLLDVKMDKKGFHAQEEVTPKKQPIPLVKDLSGKHPVSALVELCSKRKWSPPDFEMVFDCGPDHKKNFLMKVMVNGQEFKPSVAASTKKMAKANAAAAYLQSLGLYPKDPRYPL